MKLTLARAAALTLAASSATAQAAVFNVHYTGRVGSVFANGNAKLDILTPGVGYTLDFVVVNPKAGSIVQHHAHGDPFTTYGFGEGNPVTATLTIGSSTLTFGTYYGFATVGGSYVEHLSQNSRDYVVQSITSHATPWPAGFRFPQSYTVQPRDNVYGIYSYFGDISQGYADLFPETITTTTTVMVPEPEGWMLMICGFALLGAALRRRRTAAGSIRTPLSRAEPKRVETSSFFTEFALIIIPVSALSGAARNVC